MILKKNQTHKVGVWIFCRLIWFISSVGTDYLVVGIRAIVMISDLKCYVISMAKKTHCLYLPVWCLEVVYRKLRTKISCCLILLVILKILNLMLLSIFFSSIINIWFILFYAISCFSFRSFYRSGVPIAGQPHFIYSHYLKCINGYPRSCRAFHAIDLALKSHQYLGDVIRTRSRTAAAGVPTDYALRHGVYYTVLYTVLLGIARYLGATEVQLKWALEKFPSLSNVEIMRK